MTNFANRHGQYKKERTAKHNGAGYDATLGLKAPYVVGLKDQFVEKPRSYTNSNNRSGFAHIDPLALGFYHQGGCFVKFESERGCPGLVTTTARKER
ncbi:MAG: hypothetical protein M0R06_21315 [Sphaerochaeta sp.]|nr:hypothetical protein [Sphaerochaeta sp.]